MVKSPIVVFVLCVAAVTGAFAETETATGVKGLQLSLTPNSAAEPRDTRIEGVVLGVWSENPQAAFALSFLNGSTGDSSGVAIGVLNYAENYKGIHFSFANNTAGEFVGWQGGWFAGFALVNHADYMGGIQTGIINHAAMLKGIQIGAVNLAETVDSGVQIGLINLMPETTQWFENFPDEVAPGMVLLNWRL